MTTRLQQLHSFAPIWQRLNFHTSHHRTILRRNSTKPTLLYGTTDGKSFDRAIGSINNIILGLGCVFVSFIYSNSDQYAPRLSFTHTTSCEEVSAQRPIDAPSPIIDNNSLCCKDLSWTVRHRLLWNQIGMGLWRLQLPEPRVLTPRDPLFLYPQLVQGRIQRSKDEQRLRDLSHAAKAARDSGDPTQVSHIMYQVSQIAYGEGVTPQQREDFMIQYGCTGYTEEILQFLLHLCRTRGIVEIGAGNGQWARQLTDRYQKEQQLKLDSSKKGWDFVVAFDDMTDVPLSPQIYHTLTQPAKDFFFSRVRKCSSHVDAVRRIDCRGRVLLLVYPPPGNMALETVQAYIDAYPDGNDTIVYVGEGIGGANANDAFFNYFLNKGNQTDPNNRWCIVKVMDVLPPVGGKGYEKVFVLKKLKKGITKVHNE